MMQSCEQIIQRMELHGFTVEVSLNPVYDDRELGITAKELPRPLKTKVGLDELRPVLSAVLPTMKEEHRVKFFKAIQKLEARKSDCYIYDE